MNIQLVQRSQTPTRTAGGYPSPTRRMQNSNGPGSVSEKIAPDFIIRDKLKLLQLADRIQTKKAPKTPLKNNQTPVSNGNGNGHSEELITPISTNGRANAIKTANVTTVFGNGPPKNSNLRKSKFYASFSGKKFHLKSDPAKTNIEHLVNFRSPAVSLRSIQTPSPTPTNEFEDINSFDTQLQSLPPSFHNKSKLASAFGPRKLFQSPSAHSRQENGGRISPEILVHKLPAVRTTQVKVEKTEDDVWPKGQEPSPCTQGVVIIVDDLKNCRNVAESRRLSVNSLVVSDIETSLRSDCSRKHVSTTSINWDSDDILSSSAKQGDRFKDSSSYCSKINGAKTNHESQERNFTVSIGISSPGTVTNSADRERKFANATLSRKSRLNGHIAHPPVLRFSSHSYANNNSTAVEPKEESTACVTSSKIDRPRPPTRNLLRATQSYGFSPEGTYDVNEIIAGAQTLNANSKFQVQQSSGSLLNHPKISSAQIIPLSRKSSFPPITHEGSEISRTNFSTFLPKTSKPQAFYTNNSNSNCSAGFNDGSFGSMSLNYSSPLTISTTPQVNDEIEIDSRRHGHSCEKLFNGGGKNVSSFSQNSRIMNGGNHISRRVGPSSPPLLAFVVRKSKSECKLLQSITTMVGADGSETCCPEDEPYLERKRSHSLPKSFLSLRNGHSQNVLPSLLQRDDLAFERLENRRSSFFPSTEVVAASTSSILTSSSQADLPQSINMRLQEQDERPMSLDISHTKAWMRLYRDIEVSSVAAKSANQKQPNSHPAKLSTKSTSHLHHLDSQDEIPQKSPGASNRDNSVIANPRLSKGTGAASTTLFQRFSKTFSLRFGPRKEKLNANSFPKECNGEVGSSPDIFSRVGSENRISESGKYRKSNLKSGRSDKCQSGDSGIQLMDEPPKPGSFRFRRTKSDNSNNDDRIPCDPQILPSQSAISDQQLGSKKLSLVEFPNHIWDNPDSSNSNFQMPPSSSNTSSEDFASTHNLEDDGFVSNDDGTDGSCLVAPEKSTSTQNYHSLPLKYSRERKAALLEKHRQMNEEPIRAKVIREMVTTEQSYVKALHDIIQGYLMPCRAETTLFTPQVVNNIFANIEDLLKFHIKFLDSLMGCVDQQDWSQSNVGHVFNLWVGEFDLYSDYCCLNPISMATVRQLTLNPMYDKFFEACRRLQLMDKLPLHGFLLRPIQRICQYHLQLTELLKQTDESHADYPAVVCALNAMKTVAQRVNDTQREFDSLQEIVRLQNSIEGWEGPDLVNTNAAILHKGELVKMAEGEKHKEVFIALLNREVVVCKRDSFRNRALNFNLRIDLNASVWVNIDSNEEDECFGMVHNSWRIYNPSKSSWILLTCTSPSEKRAWVSALEETNKQFPYDAKMVEMAKLTTMQLLQTESQLSHAVANGTMTRNRKTRKSGSKLNLDSDAMLIEVSKLKKPMTNSSGKITSKFYV